MDVYCTRCRRFKIIHCFSNWQNICKYEPDIKMTQSALGISKQKIYYDADSKNGDNNCEDYKQTFNPIRLLFGIFMI